MMDNNNKNQLEIMDLPDYPLLTILSFLDTSSLYDMSLTSVRFRELIESTRFWRYVDARRTPNRHGKIRYCCRRICDKTRDVRFRGDYRHEPLFDDTFLTDLQDFKNIAVLALENQYIDGSEVQLMSFPKTLTELSLRQSAIDGCQEFFRFSFAAMRNLRVLVLNECDWVESSILMSIGKYENLEILSVYKCENLQSSIAYLSIAGALGFKKLRILDARLSSFGNTILKYLYKSPSLVAIYLQNDDITYKLDYFKRKLDLAKGTGKPVDDYYYVMDNDDDNEFEDFDDYSMTINNESNNWSDFERNYSLNDNGLADFRYTRGGHCAQTLPDSVLYVDPYQPECTNACKTKDCANNTSGSITGHNQKGIDDDQQNGTGDGDKSDDDDDDDGGGGDYKKILSEITRTISSLNEIIGNHSSRVIFNDDNHEAAQTISSSSNNNNNNSDLSNNLQGNKRRWDDDENDNNNCVTKRKNNNQCNGNTISNDFRAIAGPSTSRGDNSYRRAILKPISNRRQYRDRMSRQQHLLVQAASLEQRQNIDVVHLDLSSGVSSPPSAPGGGGAAAAPSNSTLDNIIRPSTSQQQQQVVVVNIKSLNNDNHDRQNNDWNGRAPAAEDDDDDDEENEDCPTVRKRGRFLLASPPPPAPPNLLDNNLPNIRGGVTIKRISYKDNNDGSVRRRHVRIMQPDIERDIIEVPLKRLSLRGYKGITDATLHYLHGLTLTLLDLTYTNVTVKGIRNYLAYHPNCRIIHERFCKCRPKLHF